MKRWLFVISLLVLGVAAACSSVSNSPPSTATELEQRAYAIDKTLMCPVCPSETINQSRVELAKQMRAIVREKLAEGWSDDQIRQFFVDRYGPSVLAEPPRRSFTLAVWILPPVALVGAVVGLIILLKTMSKSAVRVAQPQTARQPDDSLQPYLSMVDSEIEGSSSEKKPSKAKPK